MRSRSTVFGGISASSIGIGPAFGKGVVVDDRVLLGAIDARREAFEEDLVRKERDHECRLKITMKH